VFIRKDLPIVQQLVQVGHVCYEAGNKFNASDNTHLVLFQINSEKELLNIEEKLLLKGILTHKFFEPDNDYGFTSLCTEPISGSKRRKISGYTLWS